MCELSSHFMEEQLTCVSSKAIASVASGSRTVRLRLEMCVHVQEIFSRDMPYSETRHSLSPGQALEKVVCESLRPVFTADTPLEARDVMQRAWEMDPLARPSMTDLLDLILKACPKVGSTIGALLPTSRCVIYAVMVFL